MEEANEEGSDAPDISKGLMLNQEVERLKDLLEGW